MKKNSNNKTICILTGLCLILLSNLSQSQTSSREITFIKLTENIGYLIDASENEQCNCISYVDKKNFSYAALIQLADSNIVLKIKLNNSPDFRTIYLNLADVEKLHISASTIINSISVNDSIKENEWLKIIASNSMVINYLDYYRLKFPGFLKNANNTEISETDSQINYFTYINGGIGRGLYRENNSNKSYYSFGLEIGIINKKNLLLFRSYWLLEDKGWFENGTPESLKDFGLLYGRMLNLDNIIFSASLGLSLCMGVVEEITYNPGPITGTIIGVSTYKDFNTIGLPIQAEITLGARKDIGISLIIFGNINPKYSFGGLLIGLRLGALNAKNK